MELNRKTGIFLGLVALFIGFVGGYPLGGWQSSLGTVGKPPEVLGIGTELIDTFRDPKGNYFDLISTFAFNKDYFHCIITTNDETFSMATYAKGTVTFPKNQFLMAVDSARVDEITQTTGRIEMKGMARSITRLGSTYEEALVPFKVVAVDGGPGHTKDSLVLTVFYNKEKSPIQFAFFGPEPHFGHGIISGDIYVASGR